MDEPIIDLEVPQPAAPPEPSAGELLRRYAIPLTLALILLLGAVFRFIGINWDENQHLHPDERFLTMVETGIVLPGTPDISGDLPPGCTKWGGYFDTNCSPLNPYNRGFGNFVYGTFPLFLVKAVGDFVNQSGYDQIVLVGRAVSGIFDLSTVLIIFFIGRRLFGTRVGLLASLLLTASVLDIQQSHFFTVDTFANVPLLLGFWFALDIADGKRGWLAYLLSGLFFGLSLAARINLLPFAAIIAVAAAYRFARLMREPQTESAPAPLENARAFAYEAESVADSDRNRDNGVDTNPGARTINVGPLAFEIQAERRHAHAASAEPVAEETSHLVWWETAMAIGIQLGLAMIAAFLAFRIAQPYAFKGFGLNPQFLADIKWASDNVAGVIDTPPMDQWTARPDYWFPWAFMVQWGMGPGLALAGTVGFLLAGYELAVKRAWSHLLTFFWVGGLFFYMGQQVAKTDRYYLPLYPFIALLAAYFMVKLWEWAASRRSQVTGDRSQATGDTPQVAGNGFHLPFSIPPLVGKVLAGAVILAAVSYTLFWAAAFTSIYTRPVSRVTASRWIIQNVPRGSVLGNEHWDDPLPLRVDNMDPFGGWYRGVELEWYGEDTPEKRDKAIGWLDQVDYINLTSNRLYLSIPRLPLRYPMTVAYYKALFDGSLGFQLVDTTTSRPSFLGIEINDDNAEETFTVYDHPKVLIFKKTSAYSHDKTAALFNSIDLTDVIRQKPLDATMSHNAFQLPTDIRIQDYAGGTWSQIFNPGDLINQVPVLAWIVLLEVLGIVAFPLTFLVFRRFADRGYALSKAFGVLILGWGAWTISSYHLIPFSRESILVALGLMVLLALVLAWRQWADIVAFLRTRLSIVLVEEIVFFVSFFFFLLIRYGNPDLWHPSFGGEKPMDLSYLNAIIKTTWFPPYNPWFAGGYINYYYFGQVLSAVLVRLTGIVTEVAYNLLLPMFFSLTALGAFCVVFNLVRAIQTTKDEGQTTDNASSITDHVTDEPPVIAPEGWRSNLRAWAAGGFGAFLVLIIGNLGELGMLMGALQKLGEQSRGGSIMSGLVAWLIQRKSFPIGMGDWYWTATRVIPDTINEFPFFTFLYADLHAHLMALAFTLVALAFAVHAVLLRGRMRWYDLFPAALVLGALRAINTWDYPTYLAAIGGAIVIGFLALPEASDDSIPSGARWMPYLVMLSLLVIQVLLAVIQINALGVKITIDVLVFALIIIGGLVLGWMRAGTALNPVAFAQRVGWPLIILVALSALLYYPYLAFYGAAYTSVELWTGDRTTLQGYLTVWGILLFIVTTYLVIANLRPRVSPAVIKPDDDESETGDWWMYGLAAIAAASIVLFLLNMVVFAVALPLVGLAGWLLLRNEATPEVRLIALLALAGILLTMMVEVITLKGDIGRMNTVFKFYLQAWIIFSVAGAAGLALVWDHLFPLVASDERKSETPATARPATDEAGLAQGAAPIGGDSVVSVPVAPRSSPRSSILLVRPVWWGAFAILLAIGLLYPIFASWAKVNDRYVGDSPAGLNGMNYMLKATYGENNQTIELAPDHDAILWLRKNVQGSPVIAEANTGLYRWGDRISINTGLPTVIGWDWHTKQQYALIDGGLIDQRIAELKNFYNNPDPNSVGPFLKRYDVSYIYVGPLERVVYESAGLSKFEALAQAGHLDKVYDSGQVQIYKVNSSATALNR